MRFIQFIKSFFGSTSNEEPSDFTNGIDRQIEVYQDQVALIVQALGLSHNMPEVQDAMNNPRRYIAESWEHPHGQNAAIMKLLGANPYVCVINRQGEKYLLQRNTCTLSAISIIEFFRAGQRLNITSIKNTVHGITFCEDDTPWITYRTTSSDGNVSGTTRTIIEHFTNGQCTTNPAEPLHAGFPDVYVKEPVDGVGGEFRWKQLARIDG